MQVFVGLFLPVGGLGCRCFCFAVDAPPSAADATVEHQPGDVERPASTTLLTAFLGIRAAATDAVIVVLAVLPMKSTERCSRADLAGSSADDLRHAVRPTNHARLPVLGCRSLLEKYAGGRGLGSRAF